MSKRVFMVGTAILLGGACTPNEEIGSMGCPDTVTTCRVVQSGFNGYQRACMTTCAGFASAQSSGDDDDDDDNDENERDEDDADGRATNESSSVAAEEPASTTPVAANRNLGAAPAPDSTRYSAFESPCERDSQCGPGKCLSGDCYYGCQSDAQCGSGDRCSVESGVRVCMPDPNPPVVCTRSAQCEDGNACLNGGCRQTCTSTEECTNLLDRCANGFCLPDRRPLGECVVNSECDDGLVCLDGACVAACPAEEEEGGVCLAERQPVQPAPGDQTPSDLPTPTEPESPADDGEEPASTDGDAPADDDGEEPVDDPNDDGESTPSDEADEADEASEADEEPVADDTDAEAGASDGEPQNEESNETESTPEATAPVSLAG